MNTEKLNALKDRAYKTAVAHGFHEDVKPDAFYLGLVMSEAGEAINADRKGLHANVVRFVEDMELGNPFKESFEAHIKYSLEDELRPNSKGETEKEKFHDLLHGFGLEWDDRNGQIVSYRWKPQEGDVYYYIDTDGSVIREIWHDKSGVRSLSFGNCFPNRKLAEEMGGKIREMLNNKDIIAKINNDAL